MTEQEWTAKAEKALVGKKIVEVEYVPESICGTWDWTSRPLAIHFDDGTWIIPMRDDEGNDGGALSTNLEDLGTIPVLWV